MKAGQTNDGPHREETDDSLQDSAHRSRSMLASVCVYYVVRTTYDIAMDIVTKYAQQTFIETGESYACNLKHHVRFRI